MKSSWPIEIKVDPMMLMSLRVTRLAPDVLHRAPNLSSKKRADLVTLLMSMAAESSECVEEEE